MDQQTRMLKTLGCLAAAMSGTAALLGWMNPAQLPPTSALPTNEIARLAQKVVTDGVALRDHRWVDVEVAPAPAAGAQNRMLAAMPAVSTWHFLVDEYGRPSSSRDWRNQRPAANAPGTIRILVARPGEDQPVSASQWLCVRTLVAVLSDPTNKNKTSLPVHLHHAMAQIIGGTSVTDLAARSLPPTAG